MRKIIVGTASAVAVVAAGAVAGCSGSTTTVREIPVAAATAAHPPTAGPATTKTVTAPASSAPAAPRAPAGGLSSCGSPASQGGISVNAHTSCPFAENVEAAWEASGGATTVTAYSPVTGQTYTLACTATGTGYEACSSGGNYVEFPVAPGAAPASGQFDDTGTLTASLTSEQQAALAAAPADDYDSADNASVSVVLTSLGDGSYSATATDSDGDTGSADIVTVSPDGSSWSDTGMNWSGPDVYVNGGVTDYWATPAVSNHS